MGARSPSFKSCVNKFPLYNVSTDAAVAVAPQHLARQRARVSRVLNYDRAVDDHGGAVAAGISMRIGIGGAVFEVGGIEDRHVGAVAFSQQTAIPQFQRASGRAGHFVDGEFERNDAELVDIMADDARKRAVEARVRHALAYGAVGRNTVAVRSGERTISRISSSEIEVTSTRVAPLSATR